MSRPVAAKRHYSLKEKLQLKPVTDRLKVGRNKLVSDWYVRQVPAGFEQTLRDLGDIADTPVMVTIAFNLPWAIDLLIRSTRRHMPEWRLIVVDNSNKPEMRDEIRAICEREGVSWIGLPKNPERAANRSHGLSLNWTFANILTPKKVRIFGFIDHDCFPFAPTPEFARIRERPVDGFRVRPRMVEGAWYVWAGYLFFNMDLAGWPKLDFNHDQALRLDTAGRNWTMLYRHLDPAKLDFLETGWVQVPDADGVRTWPISRIGDGIVHIGGSSYRSAEDMKTAVKAAREFVEAHL